MTEVQLQEFKLDPDSELRFEVESKNEKVVLEVQMLFITRTIVFNVVLYCDIVLFIIKFL